MMKSRFIRLIRNHFFVGSEFLHPFSTRNSASLIRFPALSLIIAACGGGGGGGGSNSGSGPVQPQVLPRDAAVGTEIKGSQLGFSFDEEATTTIRGYQWQISKDRKSWEDIPEATSSSYTPSSSDAGKALRAQIIYDDANQKGVKVATKPTAEIAHVSLDEGKRYAKDVIYAGEAKSSEGKVTWSINGGRNAELFKIDENSGEIRFRYGLTPDYEEQNRFFVSIRASDTTEQDIIIQIKNQLEPEVGVTPARSWSDPDGMSWNIPHYQTKAGFYSSYASYASYASPSDATTNIQTDSLNYKDSLQQVSLAGKVVPDSFQDQISLAEAQKDFPALKGDGYSVVIIDSGVDIDHGLFGSRLVLGHDFSSDGDRDIQDRSGHGSAIASIIAGQEVSGRFKGGVAKDVNIISLQVLDGDGADTDQLQKALTWVIQNAVAMNVVAVNFSIGPAATIELESRVFADVSTRSAATDEFKVLAQLGVTVVATAGNKYEEEIYKELKLTEDQKEKTSDYAADPNAIAVGALTREGYLTYFTQRDSHVIFAPGAQMYTASANGQFDVKGGTSFAAPVITGGIVLAQQLAEEKIGRRLTIDELQRLLVDDNDKTTSSVQYTERGGKGRAVKDVDKAYKIFDLDDFLVAVNEYAQSVSSNQDAPDSIKVAQDSAVTLTFQHLDGMDGGIASKSGKQGKADAADIDWYKLLLDAGTYKLILKAQGYSSLDPKLKLFMPATGQTFINDDHYLTSAPVQITPRDAAITFTLNEEQTVYVRASATAVDSGRANDKTGAYRFHITRTKLSDETIVTLTATAEEFELLPFETEVLKLTDLKKGTIYTLRYKFTPSDDDGLPDVISVRSTLPDYTASALYQRIDAQLTTSNGMTDIPLALYAVPDGPDAAASHYRFNDFVSTSFVALANGMHFLRFADPTGRAWNYKIAVAEAVKSKPIHVVEGTNDEDSLTGSYGDDTLNGKEDNDWLYGGAGNDTLNGGTGRDYLEGGAGTDVLNGGEGDDDYVRYITSPDGVNVNLTTGKGKGGHAAGDKLESIENITGSWFDDVLTGNKEDNFLEGLGGADRIDGESGDYDTVDYWSSRKGVQVDLSSSGAQKGGDAEGDILRNIEGIFGSLHDDILTGTEGYNFFWGYGGEDTIDGGGGENDRALYTDVETELSPRISNIWDILSFGWQIPQQTGVIIDLRNEDRQTAGNFRDLPNDAIKSNNAHGDVLKNIEQLYGSKFNDLLVGNSANNYLAGGSERYAKYEGDINFTAKQHGKEGNKILIKIDFSGDGLQAGESGIYDLMDPTDDLKDFADDIKIIKFASHSEGFTFAQLKTFIDDDRNDDEFNDVLLLINVEIDNGDEDFIWLNDGHEFELSGGRASKKASGDGIGFSLAAKNAGANGNNTSLKFVHGGNLDKLAVEVKGQMVTVKFGNQSISLSDIRDAISAHDPSDIKTSAAGSLIEMTVEKDNHVFIAKNNIIRLTEGGSGDDILIGGDGDDRLNGRDGENTLHGGQGQDRFYLNWKAFGTTNVADFSASDNDRICINDHPDERLQDLKNPYTPLKDTGLTFKDLNLGIKAGNEYGNNYTELLNKQTQETYMILRNFDYQTVGLDDFVDYFEIV